MNQIYDTLINIIVTMFPIILLFGLIAIYWHFDDEKKRGEIWTYVNNLDNANLKQEFSWTGKKEKKNYSQEEKKQHIFRKYEIDILYPQRAGSF